VANQLLNPGQDAPGQVVAPLHRATLATRPLFGSTDSTFLLGYAGSVGLWVESVTKTAQAELKSGRVATPLPQEEDAVKALLPRTRGWPLVHFSAQPEPFFATDSMTS